MLGGVRALAATDLRLRRGEFYSVIGPSGCGKSTLLDVLAGLSAPSSGEILFEGRPLDGRVPEGVGVVFQEDASFAWLNVADNIVFGLRRDGVDAAEIARRLDHALRLMGLVDFAKAYPAQLSGGMRQRVCIARTLVMQPRMILLDEPSMGLAPKLVKEIYRVVRDINETGVTILLVEQNANLALRLADRAAVLENGRISLTGSGAELLQNAQVREAYLGA